MQKAYAIRTRGHPKAGSAFAYTPGIEVQQLDVYSENLVDTIFSLLPEPGAFILVELSTSQYGIDQVVRAIRTRGWPVLLVCEYPHNVNR